MARRSIGAALLGSALAAMVSAVPAGPAQAAVTMTIVEVGGDVVMTAGGTIDLTALTLAQSGGPGDSPIL